MITCPVHGQSMSCTVRTGSHPEPEICALITKAVDHFRPAHLAANRTLNKTVVEFSALAMGSRGTIASVLVKDPIGKNTVKVILPSSATPRLAADRVVSALNEILRRPATTQNVGWIVTVPEDMR
jgi:hypothetical protein